MMNLSIKRTLFVGLCCFSTCDTNGDSSSSSDGIAPTSYQTSSRALVQWKRYAALEADLMAALALPRDQVCVELGGDNCIDEVHLVPLGGNDPYRTGLMKPSTDPLATTATVVDRVLLSACSSRARLDGAGEPQVFKALDFDAPLPSPESPAVTDTITDLYRRLLARDPEPFEVALVAQLADNTDAERLSTEEFAVLSCFTIGSTTEFLFF